MTFAARQELREKAALYRQRAAASKYSVARHLWTYAANRLEKAAAEAIRGEHTAASAERYEKNPGGEPDADEEPK